MLNKRLSLALSFLVISGCVIVATRYIAGQPNQKSNPLRIKVLRGKDQLKNKPTKHEIAAFRDAVSAQSPESGDQREIKIRDFKDVPVVVVEVRNLQSETWYEDLEIELKNVSGKPIYYLSAILEFPDEQVSSGKSGVHLSWGDPRNLDNHKVANFETEHVKPGKTFVINIPKMYMKGLRAKQRLRPHVTKNLKLWFYKTYFGDGTGFDAEGRWRDFRGKGPPPKPEKNITQAVLRKSGLAR